MMRRRLLWFSLGSASMAAVFTNFIWKPLKVERHALESEIDRTFSDLEARVSNLESSFFSSSSPANHLNNNDPIPDQVEG